MVPGGLPLLGIIHFADVALIQAPRGSCGIISTLRTIGSRNTEVYTSLFVCLALFPCWSALHSPGYVIAASLTICF